MQPTQHVSNTRVLGAPRNWDQEKGECTALPATDVVDGDGRAYVVSFWLPTAEELAALVAGAPVQLWVVGQAMPPVALSVGNAL